MCERFTNCISFGRYDVREIVRTAVTRAVTCRLHAWYNMRRVLAMYVTGPGLRRIVFATVVKTRRTLKYVPLSRDLF